MAHRPGQGCWQTPPGRKAGRWTLPSLPPPREQAEATSQEACCSVTLSALRTVFNLAPQGAGFTGFAASGQKPQRESVKRSRIKADPANPEENPESKSRGLAPTPACRPASPPRWHAPHTHRMAVAFVEIEAGDGLRAVDVQLPGHAVQVGQVQLDAAHGHHAGQEQVHVPKLVPGHLRRQAPRSSQLQREAAWSRPPRTRPSLPSRPRPPAAGTPRSATCQTGPGRCSRAAAARPGGLSGPGWSSLSPSTPEGVATAHTTRSQRTGY